MDTAEDKYSTTGSVELIEDEQNERDRSRRNNRFSDEDDVGGDGKRDRSQDGNRLVTRVYVSNIPYDVKWQSLKDLFRQEVGEVEFVELFFDERVKPRGCGIIEFKTPELVTKALGKMNKYELNGRKMVVVEDYGHERDKYGRILRNSGQKQPQQQQQQQQDRQRDRSHDRAPVRSNFGGSSGGGVIHHDYSGPINTYGLSTSFLQSLGIEGPLHPRVFVANLDYKVDSKKLEQVFRLAGRIYNLDLSTDKDGNSRGFAIIEYEHPVEAVQAIAMFDQQMLYDRRLTVRLDRVPDKGEGIKLPDGLRSIGIGLGPNGEPLKDVPRNLPNIQQNLNHNIPSVTSLGGGGIGGPLPNSNLGSNLAALTNVVGGLSGALSNPLLTSATNMGYGLNSNNNDISSNTSFTEFGGGGGGGGGGGVGGTGASRDFDFGGGSSLRNYNTSSNREDYNRGSGSNLGMNNGNNSRKSNTIVISNLPTSCTWQTLRDKLRDIGEVVFAEVRGQDKGIVRFADERDAEIAIKCLDGSRFENRVVEANYF